MRSRMTTFAVLLRLMLALPGFAHQAVGQEEGKPLLPPNFSATGDLVLVGYSIAPATALPFSAAIEAETVRRIRRAIQLFNATGQRSLATPMGGLESTLT
jgi:hypothetical protein